MNAAEAFEIDQCIGSLRRGLAREFPCGECDGSGQGNHESHPYPEPCSFCWGRGYDLRSIDEEEDEG